MAMLRAAPAVPTIIRVISVSAGIADIAYFLANTRFDQISCQKQIRQSLDGGDFPCGPCY
jgi:hypothetical protein